MFLPSAGVFFAFLFFKRLSLYLEEQNKGKIFEQNKGMSRKEKAAKGVTSASDSRFFRVKTVLLTWVSFLLPGGLWVYSCIILFLLCYLKEVGELQSSTYNFQDCSKPPSPVGICVKSFSPCPGYTGNYHLLPRSTGHPHDRTSLQRRLGGVTLP